MNVRIVQLFFFVSLLMISPLFASAENDPFSRKEVFQFLKEAEQAQISISEEPRELEEIKGILLRYFSDEYNQLFLDENLVFENGEYVTYGSDFAPYALPYFSYSEETKVVKDNDCIYVFEYFSQNESGPVTYDSHYEGVLLKKSYGVWRITEYLYDTIPDKILGKTDQSPAENISKTYSQFDFNSSMLNNYNQLQVFSNQLPFQSLFPLLTILNSN